MNSKHGSKNWVSKLLVVSVLAVTFLISGCMDHYHVLLGDWNRAFYAHDYATTKKIGKELIRECQNESDTEQFPGFPGLSLRGACMGSTYESICFSSEQSGQLAEAEGCYQNALQVVQKSYFNYSAFELGVDRIRKESNKQAILAGTINGDAAFIDAKNNYVKSPFEWHKAYRKLLLEQKPVNSVELARIDTFFEIVDAPYTQIQQVKKRSRIDMSLDEMVIDDRNALSDAIEQEQLHENIALKVKQRELSGYDAFLQMQIKNAHEMVAAYNQVLDHAIKTLRKSNADQAQRNQFNNQVMQSTMSVISAQAAQRQPASTSSSSSSISSGSSRSSGSSGSSGSSSSTGSTSSCTGFCAIEAAPVRP